MIANFLIANTQINSIGNELNSLKLFNSKNEGINNVIFHVKHVDHENDNLQFELDDYYFECNSISQSDSIEITYFDTRNQIFISKFKVKHPYENAEFECYGLNKYIIEYMSKLNFFDFFKIRLLFTPGLNIHAAAIDWKGNGILFSAPSETGKSTQARLWVEHENAKIINGDRPAITIINDLVEVHGTPWSGSDPIIRNVSVPAVCIIVLEQSLENELCLLTPDEALVYLLPRFFIPNYNAYLTNKALDVIDLIIHRIPIYKLKCLPNIGAVEVLKKQLSLLED